MAVIIEVKHMYLDVIYAGTTRYHSFTCVIPQQLKSENVTSCYLILVDIASIMRKVKIDDRKKGQAKVLSQF